MHETTSQALVMQGVTKKYGNHVAVDAINLELRRGEFMTLLGPSGSGKTTTLNMVAGFVHPTAGRVLIDGQDATHIPPHKRGIGMVFQNYALFPHLTIGQNIAFPLTRTPKAARAGMVREALRLVGLEGLEERFPRQLSGGQQQRVAFARAVVYRPRLLLMDEPFGALDKKLREALQLEARRLHQELGITVLHVTHDQEEALVLSDRIAIFNRGRIEQLDNPKGIYDHPKTEFVADFIGEANIFRGVVGRDGETISVKGDGWHLLGPAHCKEALAPESRAALVIRPDKLVLVPVNSPIASGTQRIIGRVRQVVYLGGTLKYEVEALNQAIYARSKSDASSFQATPGEDVGVEWRTEHGVVVPAN
ncbi:ABC transporter ATP-binding protein [Mesorhizobium sp. B4-1-4]|uniref:ABC transporter ATP-binding protein n=1 Tax=Mesorhizobium sp. B4-1-4 TaxID=2589888 RepID=UPI00112C94A6|nr:ABC transporter ATP-binding protein [Mesorhizobium sp. B4-1-4]UCI31936.1 ABC transporter ATP-binding protein [Mesorhizobium sp. B4-1-4]